MARRSMSNEDIQHISIYNSFLTLKQQLYKMLYLIRLNNILGATLLLGLAKTYNHTFLR
jgi:hypothetical protein